MAGQSTSEDDGIHDGARDRGESRGGARRRDDASVGVVVGRAELDVAGRRRGRGRCRRLPSPPADGVAATRGRDPRAVRRQGLAARGRRARDARPWRRAAPLPPRVDRRPPRVRARGPAHPVGRVRSRQPSSRRRSRPPSRRPAGRARRRGDRRAELALPLPRRLRPDVQPLPLPLARLHPRAAARARERRAGPLGRLGRRVAGDGGRAPVRDPAARRAGGVRAARRTRPNPGGNRRGRRRPRPRHPVLAHRPRPRGTVRRRRRRRGREAGRAWRPSRGTCGARWAMRRPAGGR